MPEVLVSESMYCASLPAQHVLYQHFYDRRWLVWNLVDDGRSRLCGSNTVAAAVELVQCVNPLYYLVYQFIAKVTQPRHRCGRGRVAQLHVMTTYFLVWFVCNSYVAAERNTATVKLACFSEVTLFVSRKIRKKVARVVELVVCTFKPLATFGACAVRLFNR